MTHEGIPIRDVINWHSVIIKSNESYYLINIFVGQKMDVASWITFRGQFSSGLRHRIFRLGGQHRRSWTRSWDRRREWHRGQVLGQVLQTLSSSSRVHGRLGFWFSASTISFGLVDLETGKAGIGIWASAVYSAAVSAVSAWPRNTAWKFEKKYFYFLSSLFTLLSFVNQLNIQLKTVFESQRQWFPKTGPRTIYGPPKLFNWFIGKKML